MKKTTAALLHESKWTKGLGAGKRRQRAKLLAMLRGDREAKSGYLKLLTR